MRKIKLAILEISILIVFSCNPHCKSLSSDLVVDNGRIQRLRNMDLATDELQIEFECFMFD